MRIITTKKKKKQLEILYVCVCVFWSIDIHHVADLADGLLTMLSLGTMDNNIKFTSFNN